jgi:hypothetical protein
MLVHAIRVACCGLDETLDFCCFRPTIAHSNRFWTKKFFTIILAVLMFSASHILIFTVANWTGSSFGHYRWRRGVNLTSPTDSDHGFLKLFLWRSLVVYELYRSVTRPEVVSTVRWRHRPNLLTPPIIGIACCGFSITVRITFLVYLLPYTNYTVRIWHHQSTIGYRHYYYSATLTFLFLTLIRANVY